MVPLQCLWAKTPCFCDLTEVASPTKVIRHYPESDMIQTAGYFSFFFALPRSCCQNLC